jgi:hypothetical protein
VEPLGDVLGPTVLPEGFMALLAPLLTEEPVVPDADGAAPVVLVLLLPGLDAPTPPETLACANARVELRVSADASAIVAIFMGRLLVNLSNDWSGLSFLGGASQLWQNRPPRKICSRTVLQCR